MKLRLDRILREQIDQSYQRSRLGRVASESTRKRHFAEILADLELEGCAMRYLNSKGQITWKATPRLRDHLRDLRLDAEADYANQDV